MSTTLAEQARHWCALAQSKGQPPLCVASKEGDLEGVRALLEFDDSEAIASDSLLGKFLNVPPEARVRVADKNKWTALHFAASKGHSTIVEYLIEQRADVEAYVELVGTPLVCASENGSKEAMSILLDHKANPDARNQEYGYTALHHALLSNRKDIVSLLLDHNAHIEQLGSYDKTPLQAQAYSGNTEMVAYLLEHRADIEAKDKYGCTALNQALHSGQMDCIKFLIAQKADLETKDNEGCTLLHVSAQLSLVEMIDILLAQNMNINAEDQNKWTPLHYAANKGKDEAADVLIKSKANMEAKSVDKSTPLHIAAENGYAAVVELLIKSKANVAAKDGNKLTPLQRADQRNQKRIVSILKTSSSSSNDKNRTLPKKTETKKEKERETDKAKPSTTTKTESMKSEKQSSLDLPQASKETPSKEQNADPSSNANAPMKTTEREEGGKGKKEKVGEQRDKVGKTENQSTIEKQKTPPDHQTPVKDIPKGQEEEEDAEERETANNDITPTQKQKAINEEAMLAAALAKGKKPWGRSKIMIVGEGRAGKTALSRAILGEVFKETSSTVGISQLTCDVHYAEVGQGSNGEERDEGEDCAWSQYVKPARELEAALAALILREQSGKDRGGTKEKTLISSGNAARTIVDEEQEQELEHDHASPSSVRKDEAPLDISTKGNSTVKPNRKIAGHSSQKHSAPHSTASLPSSKNTTPSTKSGAATTADNARNNNTATKGTNNSSVAAAASLTIDNELVMKCLADNVRSAQSKFVLSLFDFGGQSVFNVIHPFFLTRHGVYLVVFNMEWLVSEDSKEKAQCLQYLTFWVNSVIIHTLNDRRETAPIVFVGTRGDVVTSLAQHESISTLLYNTFCTSMAWPFVLENKDTRGSNGTTDLFFFPVNNRLGREDRNLVRLLRVVEERIDASDYVHEEKPLCWLQLLDLLSARAQDAAFLGFEEVVELARRCDASLLTRESLPQVLHFFHQMGILMWHDEEGLRDVVILSPIEYFVTPATTVICKHSPTERDHTYHSLEVHRECKKQYYDDWMEMINKGIVSDTLLKALLSKCSLAQADMVQILMVKYGLLVPLALEKAELSFLAPALLPEDANAFHEESNDKDDDSWYDASQGVQTFFFVFTASKKLESETTLNVGDLRSRGFIPSGLFERLICKAVSWSQQTSMSDFDLRKEQVVLCYGNQRFRLTAHMDLNAIQVEVEGESPIAVHERLKGQVGKIIKECMKALRFFVAVPCVFDGSTGSDTRLLPSALYRNDAQGILFVRLQQVLEADKQKSALSLPAGNGRGRALLSTKDLRSKYSCWFVHDKVLSQYDLFLSYRWGVRDSSFTQALFDRLTTYTIDSNHRAIATFLDTHRLKEGKTFQSEFGKALVSSLIAVPIISIAALQRMVDHNPSEEDNLLAEWILMSIVYQWQQQRKQSPVVHDSGSSGSSSAGSDARGVRLRKVIPILFGSETPTGGVGNFFAEKIVDRLTEVNPRATVNLVKKILLESGLIPMSAIPWETQWQTVTVRQIVRDMLKFMCLVPWEYGSDSAKILATCAERLIPNLRECVEEEATEMEQAARVSSRTEAMPQAMTSCGSAALTTPSAAGSNMSLKELVDLIKTELGIDKKAVSEVIEEATAYLSGDIKDRLQAMTTLKDKVLYIAQQTGCIE